MKPNNVADGVGIPLAFNSWINSGSLLINFVSNLSRHFIITYNPAQNIKAVNGENTINGVLLPPVLFQVFEYSTQHDISRNIQSFTVQKGPEVLLWTYKFY